MKPASPELEAITNEFRSLLPQVRRREGEEGAYLVLYAVLSVVFFAVAALVLDITSLRQDRRSNRLTADAAAAAGAAQLDESGALGEQACSQAWSYFFANRADSQGDVTPADCTPLAGVCQPNTARTVTGSAGGLEVAITNPVPDGHDLMLGERPGGDAVQPSTAAHDGDPCMRIGVQIQRTRDLSFAGIAGLTSAETDIHSVARPDDPRPTGRAPALFVLDPTGCNALTTTSGGVIRAEETLPSGVTVPGVITVDSDGSDCAGGQWVMKPDASGGIHAGTTSDPGIIRSYAMLVGGPAYAPGDYPTRLSPIPSAAARAGRADVDFRYGTASSGAMGDLITSVGGSGTPSSYNGRAFTIYTGPCTLPALSVPIAVLTNLYVDCDQFEVPSGAEAVFTDASVGAPTTIVFKGGVVVREGACLVVNSVCATPGVTTRNSTVYVRSGGLLRESRATLGLPRTLVVVADGTIHIGGGTDASNQLAWSGPLGGSFDYLALWTPTPSTITIEAQNAGFEIGGLFFAPTTSEFTLRPRPGRTPAVDAQFIVNRFRIDGGNLGIVVGPDRTRAIQDTTRSVRLIR